MQKLRPESMMQPPKREETASFSYISISLWQHDKEGFFSDMQRPRVSGICCDLLGAKRLPLSLICSISLLQYDEEDCFSNMQRPRVSWMCCGLQGAKRLPFYLICSISLLQDDKEGCFLICRASGIWDMLQPPWREEAASLSSMQM